MVDAPVAGPSTPTVAGGAPAPMKGSAAKKGGIGAAAAAIIAATIAVEGGYVNHKADPGGETNMGVTKRVAVEHGYTGPMRTLPRDVAESIYFDSYLVKPGYAPLVELDAAVAEELFDTTVNMGAARPSLWFQQGVHAMCNAPIARDGRVGPATIAAYAECQQRVAPATLCRAMLDHLDLSQRAEYARLVRVNPKLRVFHKGWLTHRIGNVDRRKCGAVALAAAPQPRLSLGAGSSQPGAAW